MIPKSGCFFPKSEKLACFLLDSCFKFPRFFHRNPPTTTFFSTFVTKIGKNWKIHVFSLTPISNFHGFSIEITEIHVFSTLVKKIWFFNVLWKFPRWWQPWLMVALTTPRSDSISVYKQRSATQCKVRCPVVLSPFEGSTVT